MTGMTATPKTRTVAYLRSSTNNQTDRCMSLEAQRARLQAYAEEAALELVAVEVDAETDARSLDRPALARALSMLKSSKAEALLVLQLDRLTRSVCDLADLIDGYFSKRATLLSISEPIDTRTAAGRVLLDVLARAGRWEREAVTERTTVPVPGYDTSIRAYPPRLRYAPRPEQDHVLEPELSIYMMHDEVVYEELAVYDTHRNRVYRDACKTMAPGKVVLDLGTGAQLLWARECIAAGATHAYAIEGLEAAYKLGLELIKKLGLQDKITLIHGLSTEVELPERVDLIVSEVIGGIGSSEGARACLLDARQRFLKPGGAFIPQRCVTHVAGFEMSKLLHDDPAMDMSLVPWVKRIFDEHGKLFDMRLMAKDLTPEWFLSTHELFEDMDWTNEVGVTESRDVVLKIQRPGRLDGLALWMELWCMKDGITTHSFKEPGWYPVIFPMFYPGIQVSPGDELAFTCKTELSADNWHADYAVEGELRVSGIVKPFSYASPLYGVGFRVDPLSRRLFTQSV